VEVHHITPQSEDGPDTLDNAAPLCPGCHGIYGANPVYRHQIKQMRDNWYDVCEKRFGTSNPYIAQNLNAMAETLRTVREDQVKYQDTLDQIKTIMLRSLSSTASAVNKAQTFEQVVTASSSAVHLPSDFCPVCNGPIIPADPLGPMICPVCGYQP
jgi:hypothetical protein